MLKVGKNPDWRGEALEFLIRDEMDMKIRVYSSKKKKADVLVGEASFTLQMIKSGQIKKQLLEVYHKGKVSASVQVEFEYWIDDSANLRASAYQ